MKERTLIILILLMLVSVLTAQDPPKPILESGDVEHFVKTFPLLKNDIEKYGFRYEAREGNVTVPEAIGAKNEFLGILKKHGWDENFFQKFSVIILGYSSIVYGKEMKKADSSFVNSLNEIDSNPNLSDEMKTKLKEQMKLAQSAMKNQDVTFRKTIHANDLELVRPHIKEIEKVIDK